MRRFALVAALVVLTGAAVGATTGSTLAAFTDAATVQAGPAPASAFSSGSLATPAPPTATQQATSGLPVLSWSSTPVTTGAGTTTATGYQVYRYAAATGGAGVLVCTTTGGLTCTDAKQTSTAYYAVRARFADSWAADSTRITYTPDGTGPAVTFTRPTDGYANSATGLRTYVSCTGSSPACGATSDSSGITSVRYTLRRDPASTATDYCWNGASYSAASGACVFATTTGTTSWRLPGNEATAYPSGDPATLTLTIQATDGFGNTTTSSITFSTTS